MPIRLWTRFIDYAAAVGCDPHDEGEVRLQKTLLVAMSFMIAAAAALWGLIYFAFQEPIPGSVAAFAALSFLANVGIYRRRRNFALFSLTSHFLILLLPFLVGIGLGGFSLSSVVILWSLLGPIAAIILRDPRTAARLFAVYLALLAAMALMQPFLRDSNNLSPLLITVFFILNLGAVSAIAFIVLMEMFARERRLENEVKELRIVIDLVKKQEQIDQIVESEYFKDLVGKAKKVRRGEPLEAAPAVEPEAGGETVPAPDAEPSGDVSSPPP
jgi:hypothetical protein